MYTLTMAGALFEQAAHKFVRRSYDSYAACMYLLGCEYLNGNGIDVSDQGGRDAADAQALLYLDEAIRRGNGLAKYVKVAYSTTGGRAIT